MKFFIDHNINQQVPAALESIYRQHDFDHAYQLGMHELKDEPLFVELAARGYDAIVTRDRNQLVDPGERRGLREASLHWIGYKAKSHPGILGLALETSTIVSGLPYVLRSNLAQPTAFRLMGVSSEETQRLKMEVI